jgi:hypothetical protein
VAVQPPASETGLVSLREHLDPLRQAFNAARDSFRLIAIVSPT